MRTRRFLLLALGAITAGCAPLLTGSTDPARVEAILKAQNTRGCIYVRANAQPWATAGILLVGTWGPDPPPYELCWQGIPPGAP